jgi:hypothetical protein
MTDQVYGDQIDAGDEIGPLIKTPDLAQVEAFLSVWNPGAVSEETRREVLSRFTDPEAAKRDGLRAPIVPGPMSHAFLGQLLTSWAGPAGWLRSLEVNFRRPAHHGDELSCVGLITDTHDEGDRTVVKLDVYIEDPRGDRPVQGVAEVVIPAHA